MLSPNQTKAPMSEEEKAQVRQSRQEEQARYEVYAEAYRKRMGIETAEIDLLHSLDKIEQEEKDRHDEDVVNGRAGFQAGNGSNNWSQPGLWRFNKKTDLYYDENKTIRPTRKSPYRLGSFDQEGYSAALDFLAIKQGATSVVIDLPSPKDFRLKDFNKTQLNGILKLAREKGLGVEFSPNTMEFLATLSNAERDRFIGRRDVLVRNQKRNEIVMMDPTIKKQELDDSIAALTAATDKDNFDPTQVDAYKTREYTEGGVANVAGNDVATITEKLKVIEDKLKDISERSEKLEAAANNLNDDMTIMNHVLDNPGLLARARFDKTPWEQWKSDTAKKLGVFDKEKIIEKFKDKREAVNKIAELDSPGIRDSREKKLDAIARERQQLNTLTGEWRNDLNALKTELTNNPAQTKEIKAQITKAETLVARADAETTKLTNVLLKTQDVNAKHNDIPNKVATQKNAAVTQEVKNERKGVRGV